jgi:hypothetical protein
MVCTVLVSAPREGSHPRRSRIRQLVESGAGPPFRDDDELPSMPRSPASLPLSGLFGIAKPSGPTSMRVVDQLKRLIRNSRLFVEEEKLKKPSGSKKRARRDNVKIEQGGTLDPLADGVLGRLNLVWNSWCCALNDSARAVVGVGKGTKKLNDFLDCAKVCVAYGSLLTHRDKLIPWIGVSYHMFARVRDKLV